MSGRTPPPGQPGEPTEPGAGSGPHGATPAYPPPGGWPSYPPQAQPPAPAQPPVQPYGQVPSPSYGQPQPPPYPLHPGAPMQPYAGMPGMPAPVDPRQAVHPHPEPRGYVQMLRTWDYQPRTSWWRQLVGVLTLLVGGMLFAPLLLMPVLMLGVAVEGGPGSFWSRFSDAAELKQVTASSMLYLNLALASLTLVAMGLVRVLHRLRPRWLSSVRPGIRWKFLFACIGLGVIALAVSVAVGSVLPGDSVGVGKANPITGTLISLAVVVLLTTPLQAIGEEYAFRGYLMQAFGSLFARRAVANVVALLGSATLFALAHGAQNFPLFFDRFAFGLMAGAVVILTGGLEAGIALHVLNNLLAFGIAIFFGDVNGALNVTEATWWQIPVTVVQNGVYLVLALLVARRMGLSNTSSPPAAPTAQQSRQGGPIAVG